MPSRSSKHGRNKRKDTTNQSSQSPSPTVQSSLLLSPPTQLPTPLPEPELDKPPMSLLDSRPDKLVDVETPPSSLPTQGLATSAVHENYDDEEDLSATYTYNDTRYRSPPFREASLPVDPESPQPLPIPPRVYQSVESIMDLEGEEEGGGDDDGSYHPPVSSPTSAHPYIISQPQAQRSPDAREIAHTTTRSPARQSLPQPSRTKPHHPTYAHQYSEDSFESSILGQPTGYPSPISQKGHKRGVSQQEFEREYERTWDERDHEQVYHPQPTRPGLSLDTDSYDNPHSSRTHRHASSSPSVYQPYASHTTIAPRLISPTSPPPSNSRFLGGYGAVVGGVVAAAGKGSGLAQAIRRGGVGLGLSQAQHGTGTYGENPYGYPDGREGAEEDLGATIRSPALGVQAKKFSSKPSLATWDVIGSQRVLVLGYEGGGVRIYNCGNLSGVEEVLNVRFSVEEVLGMEGEGRSKDVRGEKEREARVVDVGILKDPSCRVIEHATAHGGGIDRRMGPLLGLLMEVVTRHHLPPPSPLRSPGYQRGVHERVDELDVEVEVESVLVVYSLHTHEIVKRVRINGVGVKMETGSDFVVVSTVSPASLVILSSATLKTLYAIPESALELFAVPSTQTSAVSRSSSNPPPSTSSSSYLSSGTAYPYSYSQSQHNSGQRNIHQDRLSIRSPASAYGRPGSNVNPVFLDPSRGRHSISLDEDARPKDRAQSALPLSPSRPVFALNHRLLAYASPSVGTSSSPTSLLGLAIPGTSTKSTSSRRFSSSSAASSSPNPLHSLDVGSLGSTHSHTTSSSALSTSTASSTSSALGAIGGGLRSLASRGLGMATGSGGGVTQRELGSAAVKVGESVLGGMKFLGGKAVEALSSAGVASGVGSGAGVGGGIGGSGRVSRSAPDDEYPREDVLQRMRERERRVSGGGGGGVTGQAGSVGSEASGSPNPRITTIAPETRTRVERGSYVAVVDLWALLLTSKAISSSFAISPPPSTTTMIPTPTKVAEFLVSRSQLISGLKFTPDGTSVAAILADGHFVRMFKLNPVPRRLASSFAEDDKASTHEYTAGSTHVYNLRRGRTYASIEGCEVARDGRWTAIATNHRTVHLFATNPYGGPSDVGSHYEGRVKNVEQVQFPLTELNPVARLRPKSSSTTSEVETRSVPLAFTLLTPSDLSSSPNLLPTSQRSSSQSRHSIDPNTSPLLASPKSTKKTTNFQDILLFDPLDSTLSLYRLTVDKHFPRESGIAASVHALGVTSISLPGLGAAGKLTSSSPSKGLGIMGTGAGGGGAISRTSSSSTNRDNKDRGTEGKDVALELSVKESVIATWALAQRGREWVEVKKDLGGMRIRRDERGGRGGDWLAEAEITTCSKSTRVLPRSLYLSHQFSFYTLGEDYHALIRRLHLDIIGSKIEVRTTVSINTYASPPASGAFMEDFSSPRDIRRLSSTTGLSPPSFDFDEPLANAISGSFDNTNIPAILPMFPNGVPGSTKPKSFRNSIPIRTMTGIGDGVSEGIGRLRSQMGRGNGGTRVHAGAHGQVPLEFDEEDEDFLDPALTRDGGMDIAPPSNPHSHSQDATSDFMNADVVGTVDEEIFQGWEAQDPDAIEEVEGFHHISPSRYARDDVDLDMNGDVKLDSASVALGGRLGVGGTKTGGTPGKKKKRG
ncbi:hypothetical protein BJ165DRAFT_1375558 [Panaeolus papilionaceus]|nr:hypothetical protein BJ165DRAFT_1375558 [Panaeolus papilionaceus]